MGAAVNAERVLKALRKRPSLLHEVIQMALTGPNPVRVLRHWSWYNAEEINQLPGHHRQSLLSGLHHAAIYQEGETYRWIVYDGAQQPVWTEHPHHDTLQREDAIEDWLGEDDGRDHVLGHGSANTLWQAKSAADFLMTAELGWVLLEEGFDREVDLPPRFSDAAKKMWPP